MLNKIITREQKAINRFFNKNIQVPVLPGWINNNLIKYWRSLIFDLHYLPKINLEENLNLQLWQDRPSKYFYKKLAKNASYLRGKWILIDARDKPEQKNFWITSKDVWFLEKLGLNFKNYLKQKNKQFFKQDYLKTRFCLSVFDINKLKPKILKILKIKKNKVRLPYFIEYNYLGNNFYKNWAKTKTWEWFEDKIDNYQYLAGGHKSVGCMGWEPPEFWSTILCFRPVIEL